MSSRFHKITRAAALTASWSLCVAARVAFPGAGAIRRCRSRRCGSSSSKTSCGSSPGRTRNCNTATGSWKSACGCFRAVPRWVPRALPPASPAPPPCPQRPRCRPSSRRPSTCSRLEAIRPQIAAPAPIVQEPAGVPPTGRAVAMPLTPAKIPTHLERRGRSVAANCRCPPSRLPSAIPAGPPAGALSRAPPPRNTNATGALTTLPPSATPRDEFDLGIGYIQRKDYALAEETMRNFQREISRRSVDGGGAILARRELLPAPAISRRSRSLPGGDHQIRQSTKAPDALLRLGQSLAALKEKEAACAAFGEVTRKYPHAAGGIKQAVDREQKRGKC